MLRMIPQQSKIYSKIIITSNNKKSQIVKKSIEQDIENTDKIYTKFNKLILEINSKNIPELRAKISSHLRATNVSYEIIE